MRVFGHARSLSATERLRSLDGRGDLVALLDAARDPSLVVARRALVWLVRDGSDRARAGLRELVWTCDAALAVDVADALHALGDDDSLGVAAARLRAGVTAERCRAAWVLGRLADRSAIPALCEALTDGDQSVRGAALDALARVGRDVAAAHAAAALVSDPSDEVRRRAVRAIGRLSAQPAAAVHPAVNDESPVVRREAGRLGAWLATEDVGRLLTDRDPEVRWTTAANAGRGAQALLISALVSDPHPSVRLGAAQTLGRLDGDQTTAALIDAALDDPDAMVRARVLRLAGDKLSNGRLGLRLRDELESGFGHRRQMALRTLAKLSLRLTTREADAVSQDPDPDVRLALAQLAGKLVDPPEPTFARLAEDADPAVRHAAGLHQDLEQARRLFLDRDAWQR